MQIEIIGVRHHHLNTLLSIRSSMQEEEEWV